MAQEENQFKIVSKFKPTGDQPQAIEQLTNGFQSGQKNFKHYLVLLVVVRHLLWQMLYRI